MSGDDTTVAKTKQPSGDATTAGVSSPSQLDEIVKKTEIGLCGCLEDHTVNGVHCPAHECEYHENVHRACEQAYKQGYQQGVRDSSKQQPESEVIT